MSLSRLLIPIAASLACGLAVAAGAQSADPGAAGRPSEMPYTTDWDAICAEGTALGEGCDAIRAREIADASTLPWRAVGRVNYASTRVRGHCTGTLIGPRVVATAAHCVYNRVRKSWIPARSILFAAGYRRGGYAAVSRVERYVLDPVHDPASPAFESDPSQDWALLILADPIGNETGFVSLDAVTPEALWSAELIFAGYPSLREHVLSVERDCGGAEYVLGGRLLLQQCAVMRGDSGGPVFAIDDGEIALIGVLSGVIREEASLVSGSVPVAVFAAAVRRELGDGAVPAEVVALPAAARGAGPAPAAPPPPGAPIPADPPAPPRGR